MKALTIGQPWAHLIAAGEKRIENRTWSTSYRGPLAIHAGKSRKWLVEWCDVYGGLGFPEVDLAFGALIAVVDLVDCVRLADLAEELRADPYAEGPWCWILGNSRRIDPIPCRGAQLIWETDLL